MNYLRLERPSEAIEEAEKALYINKHNSRGIIAKAEALYSLGQFEKALVQFERVWRLRQDPEIKTGILKCREVILNTIGTNVMEYDIEIVGKVVKQMEELELAKKVEKSRNSEWEDLTKVKTRKVTRRDPDLFVLGKMNEDVKFLEEFLRFPKAQQDTYGYQVLSQNNNDDFIRIFKNPCKLNKHM